MWRWVKNSRGEQRDSAVPLTVCGTPSERPQRVLTELILRPQPPLYVLYCGVQVLASLGRRTGDELEQVIEYALSEG